MDNIQNSAAADNPNSDIKLPVLKTKAPKMGQSKTARWRTAVLLLVNLLMIAHIIQWLIVGSTISPIEPSEAMETLEVGVVNAGAIMFLLAIVLTITFGRFFCGWLCHMVALQDLCAVAMSRIGVRPKPFRSRLLMFVPLVLGSYMFLWPTFKRLALKPLLQSTNTDWPIWLRPVSDIHHYSEELIVQDFWATMPPWPIALLFLFVCGFVTIYFLGAKGFCTYACPYAGLFKPLDKLAVTRIKVNDDCQQCGYCTAVCTSNVRVSEEVKDFGIVMDSGCMKTLDCVSACPNNALSVGIALPAVLKKPRNPESAAANKAKANRRYDLSLKEDLIAVLVFAFLFYATRGLFDRVPMLMAGGLAAVITMLTVQLYWLVTKPNTKIHALQLKSKGKIKPAGYLVALITVLMLITSLWSTHSKYAKWRADMIYTTMDVPSNIIVRRDFLASPQMQADAQRALNYYERSDSFKNGGYGWNLNPAHRVRMAYFHTLLGQPEKGLEQLNQVIKHGNPTDALIIQAGQLAQLQSGTVTGLLDMYRKGLESHPDLHLIRSELAKNAWSRGQQTEALDMWNYTPQETQIGYLMAKASFEGFTGNIENVAKLYDQAIKLVPDQHSSKAGWYIDIARGASAFRMTQLMDQLATKAIESPDATALTWLSAGELANGLGKTQISVDRAERALAMPGANRSEVLRRAAGILVDDGQIDRALDLCQQAHDNAESDFDRKYIIELIVRIGIILQNEKALDLAFTHYQTLADRRTDVPIFGVDYAFNLLQAARGDQAAAALERAANLDPRNAQIAQRAADLFAQLGNAEKTQYWINQAQQRQSP